MASIIHGFSVAVCQLEKSSKTLVVVSGCEPLVLNSAPNMMSAVANFRIIRASTGLFFCSLKQWTIRWDSCSSFLLKASLHLRKVLDRSDADLMRSLWRGVRLFSSGLGSLKVRSCGLPAKALECFTMASCLASPTPLSYHHQTVSNHEAEHVSVLLCHLGWSQDKVLS